MVKKGYVSSIDEAFDRYLAVGKPAYVDKYRIDCHRALSIIQNAGGIPVLAHPFLLKLKNGISLDDVIAVLKPMALGGIEAYYPQHTPQQTDSYLMLAERYDLLMTGGTDFHGGLEPEAQIGTASGDFCVPYTVFEKMLHRHPGMET